MATTISPRVLVTSCLANAIEWYDFAVYGAMAAVLVDVLLPPGTGSGGLVGGLRGVRDLVPGPSGRRRRRRAPGRPVRAAGARSPRWCC